MHPRKTAGFVLVKDSCRVITQQPDRAMYSGYLIPITYTAADHRATFEIIYQYSLRDTMDRVPETPPQDVSRTTSAAGPQDKR